MTWSKAQEQCGCCKLYFDGALTGHLFCWEHRASALLVVNRWCWLRGAESNGDDISSGFYDRTGSTRATIFGKMKQDAIPISGLTIAQIAELRSANDAVDMPDGDRESRVRSLLQAAGIAIVFSGEYPPPGDQTAKSSDDALARLRARDAEDGAAKAQFIREKTSVQ